MIWGRIELLLKKYRMTQYQLAVKTGISPGTITDLKMGRIKNPSFESMCKIADVFEVSLDFFREE